MAPIDHPRVAAGLDDSAWPADRLEQLGRCPLCAATDRARLFEGLRDRIFRVAPGEWTLWRCGACGGAYLDPRPDVEGIGLAYRAYYTHGAASPRDVFTERPGLHRSLARLRRYAHYDRAFGYALGSGPALARLLSRLGASDRAQADQLIRHLPAPRVQGGRLLDVGCGNGDFLRIAGRLGFDAVGLDPDPAAVARAAAAGFRAVAGTLDDVDLEPGSFDHVTLNHVIEHLHDPVAGLRRVRALLRPGGRIWVQTPNLDADGLRRFGPAWRGLEPPRHLVLFDAGSLLRALQAAGFERLALLPPRPDAAYFFKESLAVERGAPVERRERRVRRRLRAEAREADRASLRDPRRAECLTIVAHRPS